MLLFQSLLSFCLGMLFYQVLGVDVFFVGLLHKTNILFMKSSLTITRTK
jgi:hypothetical protein